MSWCEVEVSTNEHSRLILDEAANCLSLRICNSRLPPNMLVKSLAAKAHNEVYAREIFFAP